MIEGNIIPERRNLIPLKETTEGNIVQKLFPVLSEVKRARLLKWHAGLT